MENKVDVNESNTKFGFIIIGICIALLIFVLFSFVSFINRKGKVVEKKVTGGKVVLNYFNYFPGLEVSNLVPTHDSYAIDSNSNTLDFSVDSLLEEAASIEYEISLAKDSSNFNVSDEDIKIYLEQEKNNQYVQVVGPTGFVPLKEKTEFGSKAGDMVLLHVKKTKKTTDNYRLKIWLSDTSKQSSGNYKVNLEVNAVAS